MSPHTIHDEHIGRILTLLGNAAEEDRVTQRSLANDLGICVGLVNLLVRRLAAQGWIRVRRLSATRVHYLLTPEGMAERAHRAHQALRAAVDRYCLARRRAAEVFAEVARSWPDEVTDKPIIFVGTGELAEIAYVCLQDTDMRLVGAVDDSGRSRFFDVPVMRSGDLATALQRGERPRVVVVSLRDPAWIEEALAPLPDGVGRFRI